jgi:hypothetical protein
MAHAMNALECFWRWIERDFRLWEAKLAKRGRALTLAEFAGYRYRIHEMVDDRCDEWEAEIAEEAGAEAYKARLSFPAVKPDENA